LCQGQPDDAARRYPFSSVSEQFQTWLWLLRNERGEPNGVVSLLLRDGVLKLPYCQVPDKTLPDVLKLARQLMAQHQAHTLVTHHLGLAQQLHQSHQGFIHLRPSARYYMVSNELAKRWQAQKCDISHVQDGAGDAAFT
jgi:hypothetical protein